MLEFFGLANGWIAYFDIGKSLKFTSLRELA